MDVEHVEYKAAGHDIHKLIYDVATSSDVKAYASSFKDLHGSYRLEMGEATARTHSRINIDEGVDGELRRTMDEWQQQFST